MRTQQSKDVARKLRNRSTDAEKKLWRALRDRRLSGYKFRRQQPLGRYVADFCCWDKKLVIELDGGQHQSSLEQDQQRTTELQARGFRVLRFWNNDVLTNTEGILMVILKQMETTAP